MNLILEDIELNNSFVEEDSRFDIYLKERFDENFLSSINYF